MSAPVVIEVGLAERTVQVRFWPNDLELNLVLPQPSAAAGGGLSEQDVLDLLDAEGFVQQPTIDTINAALDDLASADDVLSASITAETANRQAADNLLAPKASPTFTGTVTLPGNAAAALQATPLQQVQALIADAKAELLGGAPSAALDTLLELGERLLDDEDVVSALTTTVAGKLAIASNLADLADKAQARINLGVRVGVDVQAYSATLATLAAITTTLFGRGFLSITDAAAARVYLELGSAAVLNVGTGAGTVAAGNDGRLTDTRTPTDNTVSTAKLVDHAVTLAKLVQASASNRFLMRKTAGAGDWEEGTAAEARVALAPKEGVATAVTGSIADAATELDLATTASFADGDDLVVEFVAVNTPNSAALAWSAKYTPTT